MGGSHPSPTSGPFQWPSRDVAVLVCTASLPRVWELEGLKTEGSGSEGSDGGTPPPRHKQSAVPNDRYARLLCLSVSRLSLVARAWRDVVRSDAFCRVACELLQQAHEELEHAMLPGLAYSIVLPRMVAFVCEKVRIYRLQGEVVDAWAGAFACFQYLSLL
jgi:hypothetical protein